MFQCFKNEKRTNDHRLPTFHFHLRPSESETTVLAGTRGDKTLQTKVGSAELCIKSFKEVNHEEASRPTCHQLSLWKNSEKKNCQNVAPTCWWTATLPVRFTSRIRIAIRQRIPENRFSRPSFTWACNPMCKSKVRSEESVFPTLQCMGTKVSQSPICDSFAPYCPASSCHHEEFGPTLL